MKKLIFLIVIFSSCKPYCQNTYTVLGIRTKKNQKDSITVDMFCVKNEKRGWIDTVYVPCKKRHHPKNIVHN